MFSFKESLAATAGLILVIGLIAISTPSGTRGQSGGLKLPFYGEVSHDKPAFHVHNDAQTDAATGVYGATCTRLTSASPNRGGSATRAGNVWGGPGPSRREGAGKIYRGAASRTTRSSSCVML